MRKALVLLTLTMVIAVPPAMAAKCLYVSSYHQGYAWSDGVERGLRKALEGHCEIRQFDMDTKRNKGEANARQAAQDALEIISDWQPDVLITSDDNAARYLVMPNFRETKLPVVFCGVNWTADEYGFPYSNVTGIVEVAPVKPMLTEAIKSMGGSRQAWYIGAATPTEEKNARRFRQAASEAGLDITVRLAETVDDWLRAYSDAQQNAGLLIVGSSSGIPDWKPADITSAISVKTKILSVTNHEWMMPYAILGYTKIPEEHGEWAGYAAVNILKGANPADIPIVTNRKWDLWLNTGLLEVSGIELPRTLVRNAKKIQHGGTDGK